MANTEVQLHNYCAMFIDLLGQKNAMRGQTILSEFDSLPEEEKNRLQQAIIQPLLDLRQSCEFFFKRQEIHIDMGNEKANALLDEMVNRTPSIVRWSDGMFLHFSLAEQIGFNSVLILRLLQVGGYLCLSGLAKGQPLRGAIEISWGVDLGSGDLVGPAVGNAYSLENKANFPRILVGEHVVNFLKNQIDTAGSDITAQYEKSFAELALDLVDLDSDGNYFIDYASNSLGSSNPQIHKDLLSGAKHFSELSYQRFKNEGDEKLEGKYLSVLKYLDPENYS